MDQLVYGAFLLILCFLPRKSMSKSFSQDMEHKWLKKHFCQTEMLFYSFQQCTIEKDFKDFCFIFLTRLAFFCFLAFSNAIPLISNKMLNNNYWQFCFDFKYVKNVMKQKIIMVFFLFTTIIFILKTSKGLYLRQPSKACTDLLRWCQGCVVWMTFFVFSFSFFIYLDIWLNLEILSSCHDPQEKASILKCPKGRKRKAPVGMKPWPCRSLGLPGHAATNNLLLPFFILVVFKNGLSIITFLPYRFVLVLNQQNLTLIKLKLKFYL